MLATLSATRTEHALADGASKAAALVDGFQLAFVIGAGILVVAFTLAIFVIREVAAPAHGHAEHEAIGEPAFAEDLA